MTFFLLKWFHCRKQQRLFCTPTCLTTLCVTVPHRSTFIEFWTLQPIGRQSHLTCMAAVTHWSPYCTIKPFSQVWPTHICIFFSTEKIWISWSKAVPSHLNWNIVWICRTRDERSVKFLTPKAKNQAINSHHLSWATVFGFACSNLKTFSP